MSARLYIPRVLVVLSGVLGAMLLAGCVGAVSARLSLLADGPDELRAPVMVIGGVALAALGAAMGALLLATGIRWASFRVDVTAEGVSARLLLRRVRWSADELKGVVLRQDGGLPQLRLVPRDGDVAVFPGWSLRARWEDGEVEDAGPALQALGDQHGFGVKHRTLLSGPPPSPDPREGRRRSP